MRAPSTSHDNRLSFIVLRKSSNTAAINHNQYDEAGRELAS